MVPAPFQHAQGKCHPTLPQLPFSHCSWGRLEGPGEAAAAVTQCRKHQTWDTASSLKSSKPGLSDQGVQIRFRLQRPNLGPQKDSRLSKALAAALLTLPWAGTNHPEDLRSQVVPGGPRPSCGWWPHSRGREGSPDHRGKEEQHRGAGAQAGQGGQSTFNKDN